MRNELQILMAVCALTVAGGGCSRLAGVPFSGPESTSAKPTLSNANDFSLGATRAGTFPQQAEAAAPQGATIFDLSGVLDKLQEVREIDPTAEDKLLDELRRTPAESRPLVAEQFRASLAYHKTLSANEKPATQSGAAAAMQQVTVSDSVRMHDSQSAGERPSAPIGTLVDPRSTSRNGVSSEALARATPYSMPAPNAAEIASSPLSAKAPADFAIEGPIYPMTVREQVAGPAAEAAAADQAWPTTHMVRPAMAYANHAPLDASAEAPPAGPTPLDSADWRLLVEQAADDLSARVADSPATTAEVHQHVSLRMLRLLAGDTEKALEPIPHISPAEHDYWSRQLFALATYLDHHSQPDDKRRAAASVMHLDEAVAHLRELGVLSVRNLAFCKNVYGFGAIEPYAADQFSPGERVSLYLEVENYHSKSTDKGYCTVLGSTYEILNDKGDRVGGGDIPDVNDCCRSRRRDFHIQYGLALPEKLPPGKYRLQLVIKDRQSDKMGNAMTPFEIKTSAF